jgi:hypothetical protein
MMLAGDDAGGRSLLFSLCPSCSTIHAINGISRCGPHLILRDLNGMSMHMGDARR